MGKEIHLYTDGSSIANGEHAGLGGCGYVLLYGDFEGADLNVEYGVNSHMLTGYMPSSDTTNQREEIKAVIEGLKKIKKTDIPIQIYSDSAYFLNCMNKKWYVGWRANGWRNSKKEPVANQDLWEELLEIIESNMLFIKYNKVKSHVGIFYNEMCDKLAKQGLDEMRGTLENVKEDND